MKKTTRPIARLLLLALLAAAVCLISSCASSVKADPSADYIDFKEASDTYTAKDAEAAGYLVISHMKITSGLEAWEDFIKCTEQGRPARIRIACTYGSAKEDGEMPILLTEVEYDGKAYILRDCYDDTVSEDTFRCLLRFEKDSVLYYVLADDDTLAWKEIKESLFQYLSSFYIPPEERLHCSLLYRCRIQ